MVSLPTPPEKTALEREKVVPGYETDLSAVGSNRQVRPDVLADEVDWTEVHPELAKELKT